MNQNGNTLAINIHNPTNATISPVNSRIAFLFMSSPLGVILRLSVPEGVVFARFVGHQFFVTALLDDASLVKDQNIIAEAAGG